MNKLYAYLGAFLALAGLLVGAFFFGKSKSRVIEVPFEVACPERAVIEAPERIVEVTKAPVSIRRNITRRITLPDTTLVVETVTEAENQTGATTVSETQRAERVETVHLPNPEKTLRRLWVGPTVDVTYSGDVSYGGTVLYKPSEWLGLQLRATETSIGAGVLIGF